jgi:serine/threonine protein kinase
LKGSIILPKAISSSCYNANLTTSTIEEISEKKKRLEEFVEKWKEAMKKSENIVKYIDHWYDEKGEYSYILMEYCAKGDLCVEILKRKNENKKFTQEVFFFNVKILILILF